MNRRDFLQLALLAPGVAPPVEGSQLSTRGSFSMHAAGGREEYKAGRRVDPKRVWAFAHETSDRRFIGNVTGMGNPFFKRLEHDPRCSCGR